LQLAAAKQQKQAYRHKDQDDEIKPMQMDIKNDLKTVEQKTEIAKTTPIPSISLS